MSKSRTQMAGAAVATLLSIAVTAPADTDARSAVIRFSVHANYCQNSACEPVTLEILGGDSFGINRSGNHREPVRIANIDAQNSRARRMRGSGRTLLAADRLGKVLNDSTFMMARVGTDRRGNACRSLS